LYNHYAVMDTRGLCPTGWHVPTDGEWGTLTAFLGGAFSGGDLKSTDTQPTPGGWNNPNHGATNWWGFTAMPGGDRASNGDFSNVGSDGYWWSVSPPFIVWPTVHARLNHLSTILDFTFSNHTDGFSVRCLRD
jgi:uncharacterized protein (TIGR02145 family)